MVHKRLNGEQLGQMVQLAADHLRKNMKIVDALNVFPVPDGDTGTNMSLTFSTGADELSRRPSPSISDAAATLAKGLLLGARGNSGVILSQLFRGFSKAVNGKTEVDARQFAEAFKQGVDTAYQAVMKPVEGTILTVAREAAEQAVRSAKSGDDIASVMELVYQQAQASLQRTPELLPILKEVGVVDSGGQGLVYIYEGFLRALRGETADTPQLESQPLSVAEMNQLVAEQHHAQSQLKTENIQYGYCTEFMIWLKHSTEAGKKPYVEASFRNHLNNLGDSLLVVSDDEVVKVHIHAENPGQVLNYAQQFGSLHKIKIDNMREQHSNLVREEEARKALEADNPTSAVTPPTTATAAKPYGIIAVAAGAGIAELFSSLGVEVVVEGGQTMNPSTEALMSAISQCNAEQVIILPNNSNIVMAAEQAAKLAEIPVVVVPSKSVPQGMAAMLAFNAEADLTTNQQAMSHALTQVKTGQVTRAVRNTQVGDVQMNENDYLGIAEGTIVVADKDLLACSRELLSRLIGDENEIVTIICGEETTPEVIEGMQTFLADAFPEVEVEVYDGGQPLYPFIIAVE